MGTTDAALGDSLGPASAGKELRGLARRLFEKPFEFDFFQAVRLLHLIDPSKTTIGHGGPARLEPVWFRALNSLSFPPSAIHALERATADRPVPVMTETFFGLTGPSGVLPRHYTELLMRLERDGRDEERLALRDWFDMFNHRLVSLFYRSWEKYRFYGGYGRGEAEHPESSPFAQVVLSLAGLGLPTLQKRMQVAVPGARLGETRTLARVDDLAIVHYAGLFAHRPRSAAGLQSLVSDYLRTAARVCQFQGQWLRLEPANQTCLTETSDSARLGISAVVGERVWDVQSKVRLRLGPLSYAEFLELLPDRAPVSSRKGFFLLCHIVRLYVGPGLDFDIQLVLRGDQVPEYRLGDERAVGAMLGWNVWLCSLPLGREGDDAVFDSEEVSMVDGGHTGAAPFGADSADGWFGAGELSW